MVWLYSCTSRNIAWGIPNSYTISRELLHMCLSTAAVLAYSLDGVHTPWATCTDKCHGCYSRVPRRNNCGRLDDAEQERVVRIPIRFSVPIVCVFHDPWSQLIPTAHKVYWVHWTTLFFVVKNVAAENVLPHLTVTCLLRSKRHLTFRTRFLKRQVAYGGLMGEFIFSASARAHTYFHAHIYK